MNVDDFSAQPAASLAWMATVPVMCTATQSSRVRAEIVSLQGGVSSAPTTAPTSRSPTLTPVKANPTLSPEVSPSFSPVMNPTLTPARNPTRAPSRNPTLSPAKRRSLQDEVAPAVVTARQAMRIFFRITCTQEDFNAFSAASLNRTIDYLKANFTASTQSSAFQTRLRTELSERSVTGTFPTTITPANPAFDAGHTVVRTSYSPTCRPTAVPSTGNTENSLHHPPLFTVF